MVPWVLEVNCGTDFFEAGEVPEAHRRAVVQALSLLVANVAHDNVFKDGTAPFDVGRCFLKL